VPQPAPDERVVRIGAAPINPSDIILLLQNKPSKSRLEQTDRSKDHFHLVVFFPFNQLEPLSFANDRK
jgi:hypothetical protein